MRCLYHSPYFYHRTRIWYILPIRMGGHATLELGNANNLDICSSYDILADVGFDGTLFYTIQDTQLQFKQLKRKDYTKMCSLFYYHLLATYSPHLLAYPSNQISS